MIKKVGKGHLFGLMDVNTRVIGNMVNNMDSEYIFQLRVNKDLVSGVMVKESDGRIMKHQLIDK